jgi:transaldolase
MPTISSLRTKIFADGADFESMIELYAQPHIKGFTTNPTLMRKAGITNYEAFGKRILAAIPDRPISLEVFADDFESMERQARLIASWGGQVNVKIPITNTKGDFSGKLISRLSKDCIRLNITALLSLDQVKRVADVLDSNASAIISVFAGRVADTGVDPVPLMADALQELKSHPNAELLWASPRELLNIFQADAIGIHIITVTSDILKKLGMVGYDLDAYSLDTVRMFYNDARASNFTI